MAKQEVQLVIKGNELRQLEQLLDTCMHRDAKRIEQFLTAIGQKRQLEAQAEQQQAKSSVLVASESKDKLASSESEDKQSEAK